MPDTAERFSVPRTISETAEVLEVLFEVLGWRWRDSLTPPTAAEIAETIRELIDNADPATTSITTGGIFVKVEREDETRSLRGHSVYLHVGDLT
jgi:hypothetical protein